MKPEGGGRAPGPEGLNRGRRPSWTRGGVAALVAAVLTALLAVPLGPLPALGPTFNPITGVYAATTRPLAEKLQLPGLLQPVTVQEDAYAVPHIFAANDHDLFFAQGYLVARSRLAQLDLLRRQGSGRLAEVIGAKALPSDQLQLTLGLRRTAEASAKRIKTTDPRIYSELQAYADGVNSWIAEARRTHAWPAFFRLLGYEPASWDVVDSLVVQGVMTEDLAFSKGPLERAILTGKLGAARTDALFPTLPVNPYHPYNPGPFPTDAPVDQATLRDRALAYGDGRSEGVGGAVAAAGTGGVAMPMAPATQVAAQAAGPTSASADLPVRLDPGQLVALVDAVENSHGPYTEAIAQFIGNSNNWVVGGALTDTGKPYLAGDPHLGLTLPAIWYELHLESPDIHAYGVSIPGTPGVIIGHNRSVAWSLTNVENQQTFYYAEETSADHPGAYLHNGQWVPFGEYKVDIPVKGQATRHLTIPWTVHGPVLSELPGLPPLGGRTISMAYTGSLFSQDFAALDALMRARNAADVQAALKLWGSPTQNFAYATSDGDFGIISAGYYPLVKSGKPWLPLPGTGEADWVGLIPYDRVPQVKNPSWGFAFSANQREVADDYPYHIGTTDDFFDIGYRAETLYRALSNPANRPITQQKMADLQASNLDDLARRMVPALMEAGRTVPVPDKSVAWALDKLAAWNLEMKKGEAAPAVWETFLTHYIQDTYGPWWKAKGLEEVEGFSLYKKFRTSHGGWKGALLADLEAMTTAPLDSAQYKALAYPEGAGPSWFDGPDGTTHSREEIMMQALGEATAELSAKLGPDPARWTWGDVHHRLIPSLTQAKALAAGPYPADGNGRTLNATGGDPATSGPSWRMVANLADPARSWGVYPGGQSGDPSDPHYSDQLPLWLDYRYKTLIFPTSPGPADWVARTATLGPVAVTKGGGSK